MTSNKNKTIRRGERGISAAMADGGFKQHAYFRREMLDEHINQADALQLMRLLTDLNTFEDSQMSEKDHLLVHFKNTPEWIDAARTLIYNITNLQNLLVTAPLSCIEQFRLPVLKKAQTHQNLTALSVVHKASTEGRFELSASVAAEIQNKLNTAKG